MGRTHWAPVGRKAIKYVLLLTVLGSTKLLLVRGDMKIPKWFQGMKDSPEACTAGK